MALHLALSAVLAVAVVELAMRLPLFPFVRRIMGTARKAQRTVFARASDHWKERAMRAYTGQMVSATAALVALLGAIIVAAGALIFALDAVSSGFFRFLLGPLGLIASLALATLYYAGRVRVG